MIVNPVPPFWFFVIRVIPILLDDCKTLPIPVQNDSRFTVADPDVNVISSRVGDFVNLSAVAFEPKDVFVLIITRHTTLAP